MDRRQLEAMMQQQQQQDAALGLLVNATSPQPAAQATLAAPGFCPSCRAVEIETKTPDGGLCEVCRAEAAQASRRKSARAERWEIYAIVRSAIFLLVCAGMGALLIIGGLGLIGLLMSAPAPMADTTALEIGGTGAIDHLTFTGPTHMIPIIFTDGEGCDLSRCDESTPLFGDIPKADDAWLKEWSVGNQ